MLCSKSWINVVNIYIYTLKNTYNVLFSLYYKYNNCMLHRICPNKKIYKIWKGNSSSRQLLCNLNINSQIGQRSCFSNRPQISCHSIIDFNVMLIGFYFICARRATNVSKTLSWRNFLNVQPWVMRIFKGAGNSINKIM